MGYLIVAASIVAFSAYVWLIGKEPATRVASYAYVNPLIALLLGAVFAHERPAWLQYAGAMLVLAGVFSTLAGRRVIEPREREARSQRLRRMMICSPFPFPRNEVKTRESFWRQDCRQSLFQFSASIVKTLLFT